MDLPIAGRFEAFGRTRRFFDRTIALIRGLADAWASACSPEPSRLGREGDPDVEAAIKEVANDAVVQAAKATIGKAIDEIVAAGSAMEVQPSGTLPFDGAADKVAAVEAAVDGVVEHLSTRQAQHRVFSQYRYQFETFAGKLRKVREELQEAQRCGTAKVMIVQGQAGTGKTHLLCDVTHHRLAEDCPGVLLLGQSFTSDSAPWPQAAELLDLSDSSAAEFVGALECAAQAAGVRALVLIDALNEGKGLSMWPTHLPGFLAHFTRSDWVGVVLSIRSSYDGLIPEAVREHAVVATHRGFGERSYDAMRTFFTHYGLELPSTPLIAPEFGNPLFLKTLCLGLQGQGETRLRKDIQGITSIFGLYIASVDRRVASRLGLPQWQKTAEEVLRALCSAFPTASERWLPVEAAEELVNGLLPGRPYEESLYRALVVEGLLVQDVSGAGRRGQDREIVFIAYDRLADHLIVEALLGRTSTPRTRGPRSGPGGALAEGREFSQVLAAADEVRERRAQARHPVYTKPELVATGPNQVWSWDITKLKGPIPYLYYSLYVILDLFSRYAVGWMVARHENAHLAERLIAATCLKQGLAPAPTHDSCGPRRAHAEQARRAALLGSGHRRQSFAAPREQRQSVLRSAVPDREVPAGVSWPVRLARPRVRRQPRSVRVVQRRAPSQRPELPDTSRRALRPRRDGPHGPAPHAPGGVRRPS